MVFGFDREVARPLSGSHRRWSILQIASPSRSTIAAPAARWARFGRVCRCSSMTPARVPTANIHFGPASKCRREAKHKFGLIGTPRCNHQAAQRRHREPASSTTVDRGAPKRLKWQTNLWFSLSPLRGLGSRGNRFRGLRPRLESVAAARLSDAGGSEDRGSWNRASAGEGAANSRPCVRMSA